MGLDGFVFCDCTERERLKIPHPYPELLFIDRNGAPEIRSDDPAIVQEHDDWIEMNPCQHEAVTLEAECLGNASQIRWCRGILKRNQTAGSRYPVLLEKVLFSGTHTGDFLRTRQVIDLAQELKLVRKNLKALPAEDRPTILELIQSLEKLAKASLKIKKPLAF
jgi:hypothetical protein